MQAVELFAGAGGLAMGVGLAGFAPLAVIEWDKWACDTIRENKQRGFPLVQQWPLIPGDVRKWDMVGIPEGIDLVAGGPPCQPFSMGGKHRAHDDERDMFPATVEIVRRLKPRAFIVENVKGLTRSAFYDYFQYIQLQFEFPEVVKRPAEDWRDHLERLQVEKTSGRLHDGRHLAYNLVTTLVNAADYGVPQRRERVFMVGFRDDLGIEWSFPRETHSYPDLLVEQYVTGDYWEEHKVARKHRPSVPDTIKDRLPRLAQRELTVDAPPPKRWRTVRDALSDVPDPQSCKTGDFFRNHRFQSGARSYHGHTGSPLDLPAKTLKAGDHGVPGGENMMVKPSGEVRYFTVRESARLQTFPDGYVFHGSWSETMRQLGNAVPVMLAQVVASSVAAKLIECDTVQLISKMRRQRQ
ncbi:DNA (cytosine-5)-methyltransferase 1 [Burkholderiales bacterium]|nr:DNA (cytosine-5)-methyltransferase 1 [Burkholderiales bacterium]